MFKCQGVQGLLYVKGIVGNPVDFRNLDYVLGSNFYFKRTADRGTHLPHT